MIVILFMVGFSINLCCNQMPIKSNLLHKNTVRNETVKIEKNQLGFYNKHPKEGLKEALEYYNIKYPKVVYAQARLETGNFTSRVYIDNNNLFGLYDSKNKEYYKFDYWWESILAYSNSIQNKYNDGDYYKFLEDINYAKDPKYISKLQELIKEEQ